jgi:hypothetical protein
VRRDSEVHEDEGQPDVADLAVELQQRVLPEGRGHHLEASHERELEPHHRQAGEPQRHGEARPEVVVGLARPDDREHQRRQDDPEVHEDPRHRSRHERHARTPFPTPRDTTA